jgi:hypothetical protein
VNTSSRKGILPVRLGIEPDTKTALSELNMDPSLADSMTDKELDLLIIDNEYNRIVDYYNSEGKDGKKPAGIWKAHAMKQIKDN